MEVVLLIGVLAFVALFIVASILAFITGLIGLIHHDDDGMWVMKILTLLLGISGICLFGVLGWSCIVAYQNGTLV